MAEAAIIAQEYVMGDFSKYTSMPNETCRLANIKPHCSL